MRLQDYGSNHLCGTPCGTYSDALEPSDCDPTCGTLPVWLDAYGSNAALFLSGGRRSAAGERVGAGDSARDGTGVSAAIDTSDANEGAGGGGYVD